MYGFIHCCLEDLVTKLFGEDTWKEILKRSGVKLRGASFLIHKVYDDDVTLKLVATTSEVVGLDVETCLEAFGNHFLKYCQLNGYDKILRVLGSNLHDFLTNLDNLHDHLSSIYPGMRAPSFRVTNTNSDGTMHLHYYSERKGLSAIVRGLVCIVSKEFFKTEVVVKTVEECDDGHVILEVRKKDDDHQSNSANTVQNQHLTPFGDQYISDSPSDILFNSSTLCTAFPFHVMFARDFSIIQIGNSLLRLVRTFWKIRGKRVKFNDLFVINRPVIDFTFDSILSYCNQVFVVKSRSTSDDTNAIDNSFQYRQLSHTDSEALPTSLRLKGQMVPIPESDAILFLCSPRVKDLADMENIGLYLTDFPIHDKTRDLILITHRRRGERELVEKLDEATNHIRILDAKLREENKRTEEILHNIFPAKIANLLCANIPVEAETFEPVSCLFSDIVGFTSMCGSPNIEPMDIVRLLNKLYIQFDNLTSVYGVYKVETIGDAYVIVSGVPEMIEDHADRIVHVALSMVKVTNSITSPADGKPIQMRIGIHSGSCMAGIVGLQMPRYCLFGNTVTLANKMESNSKPGQVHISEETRRHLSQNVYKFSDELIQTVFPFATYFVDNIDDDDTNHCDDNLLVSNAFTATEGHFVSPSCSPVHTPRALSSVGTPSATTPAVSPVSTPHRYSDISYRYGANTVGRRLSNNNYFPDLNELPEFQISEATPKHKMMSSHHKTDIVMIDYTLNENNKENIATNKCSASSSGSGSGSNVSSSNNNQKKAARVPRLFKVLSTDSTPMNDTRDNNNRNADTTTSFETDSIEQIIEQKISSNSSSSGKAEKQKSTHRRHKSRCFFLFCLGSKKHQSLSHVRVNPKSQELPVNTNTNIRKAKCEKMNGNYDNQWKYDNITIKNCDNVCAISATTSQSQTTMIRPVIVERQQQQQHRKVGCFSFRSRFK